jgi:phosphoribosylformylglycinamidine synthase II
MTPEAPGRVRASEVDGTQPPVHRIEVFAKPGQADPLGDSVAREARAIGLNPASVRTAHVYLIGAHLAPAQVDALASQLLADPVVERAHVGVSASLSAATTTQVVEVHPLPGVMDPVAQSVELGVRDVLGVACEVSTGWRYDLEGLSPDEARRLGERLLANPVIQRVTLGAHHPRAFPRGASHDATIRSVALTALDDAELVKLSRSAHLFLSLDEMRAVRDHYRAIGREPREIELETLAQTWSEHCVHKTLKSTITYSGALADDPIDWRGRPGVTINPDGSATIANLLKSTVAAATFELIGEGIDWTLSVFKDNSGVVALDDQWGVCIKVETHNHPSAIEPYGGAATGAGGCIRDVIGTGLGARPIASTDVFCVAMPEGWVQGAGDTTDASPTGARALPPGTLHPRRVLTQVVAGVRDYGNRMGIPTINGAVSFDDRYVGNPLVFCGCVGLIPRALVKGRAQPGDSIVAIGGRTGRDGIHGATFSSAELEHTSADEFAHAVQIGNAITEKQALDAILRARDEGDHGVPLFNAITDCGAGGFSSAVGEMGAELGAEVHLERAPLKYPGLSPTEVWISEAQERMVLAVPTRSLERLREICRQESVEMAELGTFGVTGADGHAELVLRHSGVEVGRLSMALLHEAIPMPVRTARTPARVALSATSSAAPRATPSEAPSAGATARPHIKETLLALLADPNIASKHWIVRQYDHEVRGATVVKPLVGPRGRGPGNASVIEPIAGSGRGVALACGLQTGLGDPELNYPGGADPYLMALGAIDECVRNLVCVGVDPARIAILDNFCWPSCQKEENLASLVRASVGCYDGAKAYRTPFVSGKDSLNNQLTYTDPTTGQTRTVEIPPTLLITGMGIVPDISRCLTSDAQRAGNVLLLVGAVGDRAGERAGALGGSRLHALLRSSQRQSPGAEAASVTRAAHDALARLGLDPRVPTTDLKLGPGAARAVAGLVADRLVRAAHDVSEGGVLVAVAEMLIGALAPGRALGATIDLSGVHADPLAAAFGEAPSRYVLEVEPTRADEVRTRLARAGVGCVRLGELDDRGVLAVSEHRVSCVVGDLHAAWSKPLDW